MKQKMSKNVETWSCLLFETHLWPSSCFFFVANLVLSFIFSGDQNIYVLPPDIRILAGCSCFEIDFPAAAAWGFFVSLIFCWKKFLCLSNYKFVSCVKFQSGAQCKKWGKNTGCIWLKDFEFFWKVNSSRSSKIKKFSGHHSLQKVQIYFYVSSKWK